MDTLDTYTNEENKLTLKFCSTLDTFLEHSVVGETMFLCPTSSEQVLSLLQHFENARLKSPLDTKAIIVLPALNMQVTKQWNVYLNKYQMIHQYPAQTYLFTSSHPNDENENIKPISWPMNVYLSDYTLEDRLHQSNTDAQIAADIKLNDVLTEMENGQFRTVNDQIVEVPNNSGRLE